MWNTDKIQLVFEQTELEVHETDYLRQLELGVTEFPQAA